MPLLSKPRNLLIAVSVVTTVGVLAVVAAVVGLHGGDPARPTAQSLPVVSLSPTDSASPSPSPSPTEADSPSPTISPTPSRKPSPTKKKAPPPKPKPVAVAAPPPPPPAAPPPGPGAPPPGATCPKLTGPVAPRADVGAALSAAAGRAYHPTLSLSDTAKPAISVRVALVQAIAWEETGWQNTIEACDGGLGTMQVMPDTATWINGNYGWDYQRADLTGNIMLGTGLLAWLTRYFGDRYFNGSYSLGGDPVKIVLLDMVISGYQAGFGKVDEAIAAGQDLPNRWYVDTVEGFMTHAPWASAG